MDNTQPQPTPNQDGFTTALADVLLFLRRKREARIAGQRSSTDLPDATEQP